MGVGNFEFAYPWVLASAILLLPMILKYLKGQGRVVLRYSSTQGLNGLPRSPVSSLRHSLFWLKVLLLMLLILAAARPRFGKSMSERKSDGLDIVLAIDTSGSMRALDLKLNGSRYDRLTVVKNVLLEFIKKRIDDRIGMVVFGTESYTQAPLTLDHEVLIRFLGELAIEMAGPQTAIGDALATASKRLEKIHSKSKIIILLTDGENTAGTVDPREAAAAAKALGIKVYTIGVGSNGMAPMPVQGFFGTTTRNVPVKIDQALLQEIAATTGGKAFLAANTEALREVYNTIDQLEKTEVSVEEYMDYKEAGSIFLLPALLLFILQSILDMTKFRTLP